MTFRVEIVHFFPQTKTPPWFLLQESELWELLHVWDNKACVGCGLLCLCPQFLLVLVQVYLLLKGRKWGWGQHTWPVVQGAAGASTVLPVSPRAGTLSFAPWATRATPRGRREGEMVTVTSPLFWMVGERGVQQTRAAAKGCDSLQGVHVQKQSLPKFPCPNTPCLSQGMATALLLPAVMSPRQFWENLQFQGAASPGPAALLGLPGGSHLPQHGWVPPQHGGNCSARQGPRGWLRPEPRL